MKKLKVLNSNLTSPFKEFKYELGKQYVCENFNSDPTQDCAEGFYATDIEGLFYSFNIDRKVYEVEVEGKQVIFDQFKQRFEKQTLIREVPFEEIKELALAEEVRLGYKLSEILFPVNPLLIESEPVTEKEIALLREWASVRASVRASVWASVWDSVGASVWDSVGDSVEDSVEAYIYSLFPNIKDWKYINHKEGENPFQSAIDLWHKGLVPSFDEHTWRLHAGKEAKIVFEINKSNL